jgi:hypothetical protein
MPVASLPVAGAQADLGEGGLVAGAERTQMGHGRV